MSTTTMNTTIESAPTEEETPVYQCACLPTIKAQLAKHHNVDEVSLELGSYMSRPTDDDEEVTFRLGFKPLFYSWLDKRKVKKGHVSFRFCPMCGKRI